MAVTASNTFSASDFRLKVEKSKYNDKITAIGDKLRTLNDDYGRLETLRRDVDKFYTDGNADELKSLIDQQLVNVRKGMDACEESRKQIENFLKTMDESDTALSQSISEAMDAAKNVFN